MEVGTYVSSNRCKKISTKFKAETIFHKTTFAPSTAKPGDDLSIKVPQLEDVLIIPGTLALTFDLDVVLDPETPGATVNTFPVNNLAANIISKIKIKLGSEPIYELEYAHLYNTYKDLWLSEKQRINAIFKGIQDEELRKMRADLKASPVNRKASNTALRDVFGKRYKVPLGLDLLDDHVPLPTGDIKNAITIELKINTKEYVLKYSDPQAANFTMKNICLHWGTLQNAELKREIINQMTFGYAFLYDHVHHYKKKTVSKKDQLLNVKVNVDRKSLKGILLLFQDEFEDGERDSEEFPNPNIKEIKITIGQPNKVYSTGYEEVHQWDEIFKHFASEDCKIGDRVYLTVNRYYTDNKYALWIDLRSTEDNNLHGTGREQSKEDINLAIKKKNNGDGNYTMHIFVVADARVVIKDMKFGKPEY
jgi:hypothetical protein